MSEIDRDRLKDLFADALELHPEERIAFVYNTCVGEPELITELLSLLAAHDAAHNLIEQNLLDIPGQIAPESNDLTDRRFGNYRIIREIGHGGMGTVFLATRDDGEFDQQVALKIARQSIADSYIIERFRNERQILAGLKHPNIATLYDGGVSDIGEPFMAMEYVDGLPLVEYAAKANLTLAEKLGLFIKVCSAVAFAHRSLVIHRDIKPSNILVTPDGEPKLLDFGLAKMFDYGSLQTQTAMRAFTPAYASPEQIRGSNITTASDIYSLGVVFYELLTGEKPLPLDNKSLDEVLQTINTNQPAPPSEAAGDSVKSEMRRQLKGDLDNIALMALRKEPERRYGSAEEFAQDIQNYLSDIPVRARPNTFGYLFRKFVQRNRLAVAAAGLIVISLLTGVIFTLWQANVARRERDRAEKRFQDVRKLSTSLLFEITPKIENLMGATEAREAVVTRALEYLDSLATESTDDQTLQSELAAAYEKVGDLQGNPNRPNLSNFAGAIDSYAKARAIRERLPKSAESRLALAKNLQISSLIKNRQNDIAGSIADSQASLAIYDELRSADPTSAEIALAAIGSRLEYAQIYALNNQYGESVPIFRQALADLATIDQSSPDTQKLMTRAYSFLGNALSWNGQQPDAEAEMATAIGLCEGLSARFPNVPEINTLAWQTYQLASSIYEDTDIPKSLKYGQLSLRAAELAADADKADSQARHDLARAYSRIGVLSAKLNNEAAAGSYLSKAEKALDQIISGDPRNTLYQRDLGILYVRMGDASEKRNDIADAMLKYQNSAVIFEKISKIDAANTRARRDLAQSLKSVGMMAIKLGQYQSAKRELERALSILSELQTQNALGKYDEKMIGEIQAAIAGI